MMAETKECKNHEWIPLLGFNKGKGVPTSLFTCLKCGDLKVGATTIKISQYRLDMGELPINNVLGIKLMESPTANQTASGLIVSMTYTAGIQIGDLLYFSNEAVYRADADDASTYPVRGLALATANSGSNKVLLHGVYRDSTKWPGSLAPGGVCYLSKTVGDTTQSQPTTPSGVVIQVVGIATHTDTIYFNPSADYLTHT
jgi:hypothetical protein